MNDVALIEKTIAFVKKHLEGSEGGHDWFHTQRVFNNTLMIAKEEEVDLLVVSLAALLHDIADPKFHDGDETVGPRLAEEFLKSQKVSGTVRKHVGKIIRHMSFKNSLEGSKAAIRLMKRPGGQTRPFAALRAPRPACE